LIVVSPSAPVSVSVVVVLHAEATTASAMTAARRDRGVRVIFTFIS